MGEKFIVFELRMESLQHTGWFVQGFDAMYGGGQGSSGLVGVKRDADMSVYGQVCHVLCR